MTAEERAALIDRLAPLIIEERRKAAEQNPKRPPWYMMNIAPGCAEKAGRALQNPITPPRRGRYAAKAARGRGGP